ncbi:MAG TPA: RDD family protein [Actinocrinis sp.]|uniref:RDD family protein n=1 Tax=Actinocrinis sp. TaxID=1920516 RepID=UPI002D35D8BF|nr:RDD family protein [Actinocrinis sp.]HZU56827.1 RDD family protein [Actinocrinis sp.]
MTTGPEAGYYADPSIPGYIRYWDGTQWVPGTSRPGPELQQQEDQAALQQSVAAQLTQALPAQVPPQTQAQAQISANPAPAQTPTHTPTPTPTAQTGYPWQQDAADIDNQAVSSVATMVVPSAFANRGAYGSGWSSGSSSPFDAIPGLYRANEQEESKEAEVRVVELASAGSRILARIIDLCIAVVLSLPATVTLMLIAHRHDHAYVNELRLHATTTYRTLGMDAMGITLWAATIAVVLLTAIILEAYRLPRTGQTTGRRMVGVQVVTAGTAEEVSGGAASTRAFLFWLLALIPVVDVLALGGVLWGRPYRQGLHEKLSRTLTIRA